MSESPTRLSDQQLQSAIEQRFADEQPQSTRFSPANADITVTVNDSNVTLSGFVTDDGVRDAAVDLAATTPGVRAVTDRLQVAHSQTANTDPGYQGRSSVSDPKASDDDNLIGEPRV